jgi:phosphoribosylformylglycinamidine synthase PurS subunit
MIFKAYVNIMPHPELLDPQGKAVAGSMKHLELGAISDVRIGKRMELTLEADSAEAAEALVESACRKLLANPIMEHYAFRVEVQQPAHA